MRDKVLGESRDFVPESLFLKDHYIVSFLAPHKDIGLKLVLTQDQQLLVVGFNKVNNDQIGPAELTRQIHIGDILTSVDHIDYYKLGPEKFIDSVSFYEHDKEVKWKQIIAKYANLINI